MRAGRAARTVQRWTRILARALLALDRSRGLLRRHAGAALPQLPELSERVRAMAGCIATSRLGVYRVRGVEPGAWVELESVMGGVSVRVASPCVSREAVRWHVLLCRVMEGGPMPSLWGAAAFYEPAEEDELLAELRRIASAHDLGSDNAALESALRVGVRELVCFVPLSRRAERVPYTLEGDAVTVAEATWQVREPRVAFNALCGLPQLAFDGHTEDDEGVTFAWLTSRRELLARRQPLPLGAICMESGPVAVDEDGEIEFDDVTSLGTFTLRGECLEFFGMSEARLDAAVALIERDLGRIAGRPARRVRSLDDAMSVAREGRAAARRGQASLRVLAFPGGAGPELTPILSQGAG